MDKPKRDEKRGLIARNHRPIKDKESKSRIWCGDKAVDEYWEKLKKKPNGL